MQFIQQLLQTLVLDLLIHTADLEDQAQVVLHRKLGENRRLLRQIAQPPAGPEVHGQGGDIFTAQPYAAGGGPDHAGNHVKHGGLPGPVWSQEPHYPTPAHLQRYTANHFPLPIGFVQVDPLQELSVRRFRLTHFRRTAFQSRPGGERFSSESDPHPTRSRSRRAYRSHWRRR